MVDAWLVRGYKTTEDRLFDDAKRRVANSPRLRKYDSIIFNYDGEDHLRWVIRGRVGEIEAWAKQIAEDSE